jgi:predicted transport protein
MCGTLTDELLAYDGVNMRESWKQRRFNKGRNTVASLLFKGKKLCLALALDPAYLEGSKYKIENVSDTRRYSQTPTLIKLTSARKVKYAKELIALMMADMSVQRDPQKGPATDTERYMIVRESVEVLVSRGQAKLYNVDAATTNFFNQKKLETEEVAATENPTVEPELEKID